MPRASSTFNSDGSNTSICCGIATGQRSEKVSSAWTDRQRYGVTLDRTRPCRMLSMVRWMLTSSRSERSRCYSTGFRQVNGCRASLRLAGTHSMAC